MKKLILSFLFFSCCIVPRTFAQLSHIFLVFHSGSYMDKIDKEAQLVMNAGIGYERDLNDKLSISFSLRRLFYLAGIKDIKTKSANLTNGYSATYLDTYSGIAFDYEAKYFFDTSEEGYYFSSCASFQMMTANVDIRDVYDSYGYLFTPPVKVEIFEKGFTLFPLTFKLGKRYSGDTFTSDWFIGYSFNLGAGQNIGLKYADYLPYDKPNTNTFIFGFTTGVKF